MHNIDDRMCCWIIHGSAGLVHLVWTIRSLSMNRAAEGVLGFRCPSVARAKWFVTSSPERSSQVPKGLIAGDVGRLLSGREGNDQLPVRQEERDAEG